MASVSFCLTTVFPVHGTMSGTEKMLSINTLEKCIRVLCLTSYFIFQLKNNTHIHNNFKAKIMLFVSLSNYIYIITEYLSFVCQTLSEMPYV